MTKEIENYKQQLFETAAEYGKAGRAAYTELEQHIDEAIEDKRKPKEILAELGEPEQAIRKILKADGKATYPFSKIVFSGILIALGLAFLAALSSLLMPLGSRMAGMTAISGDPINLPYTTERCKDFQALTSTNLDCRHAAMLHHYNELTDERLFFAVLGLVSLLGFWYAVRKGWVNLLPRKTLLLLASSIYIAVGGFIMLIALGNLSAGQNWGWLSDFLTGVPVFIVGILLLAFYLGYITGPHKAEDA
jgi:hypothetical protein